MRHRHTGFNCAPMEAVFVGSVGWTWNLTISSAGLKEVDFDLLSSTKLSLFTVERMSGPRLDVTSI